MTTIADYIAQHGADATAAFLRTQPAFAAFNLAWHAPADILPACNALGINTVEDAQALALAMHNALGDKHAAFAALARPAVPIAYDSAPVTVWPSIHNMLGDAGMLVPSGLVINHADRNYRMPSYAECVQLAQAFPGKNRKHTGDEKHDCEDFVKEFLGWLASQTLGNLAAGYCAILVYTGDSYFVAHAVVLVLTSDQGLKFIEPQGGHVYPLDYKRFAGQYFATRVLVHTLIF